MRVLMVFLLLLISSVLPAAESTSQESEATPSVVLNTSAGPLSIRLNWKEEPEATKLFYEALKAGIYESNYFFQLGPDFLIHRGTFERPDKELAAGTHKLYRPLATWNQSSSWESLSRRGVVTMTFKDALPESNHLSFSISLWENGVTAQEGIGFKAVGRVRGRDSWHTIENILRLGKEGEGPNNVMTLKSYFFESRPERVALLGSIPRLYDHESTDSLNIRDAIPLFLVFLVSASHFYLVASHFKHMGRTKKVIALFTFCCLVGILFYYVNQSVVRDVALLVSSSATFYQMGQLRS